MLYVIWKSLMNNKLKVDITENVLYWALERWCLLSPSNSVQYIPSGSDTTLDV